MFHGVLEVFHDALLPDNLLDACLCLNVEWVRVELCNLPLAVLALAAFPVVVVVEELGKQLRVVNHGSQLRLLTYSLLP